MELGSVDKYIHDNLSDRIGCSSYGFKINVVKIAANAPCRRFRLSLKWLWYAEARKRGVKSRPRAKVGKKGRRKVLVSENKLPIKFQEALIEGQLATTIL